MFSDPSPFSISRSEIDQNTDLIIVSDLFLKDYVGGAELTLESLITQISSIKIARVRSRDLTEEIIIKHADKYWLFGNTAMLDPRLRGMIATSLRYSIIEFDYKYCTLRA